jgi:hypothetical protein
VGVEGGGDIEEFWDGLSEVRREGDGWTGRGDLPPSPEKGSMVGVAIDGEIPRGCS